MFTPPLVVKIVQPAHRGRSQAKGVDGMQALVELIAGFIALLAAAALSQFGVDLQRPSEDREVRRVADCGESKPRAVLIVGAPRSESC